MEEAHTNSREERKKDCQRSIIPNSGFRKGRGKAYIFPTKDRIALYAVDIPHGMVPCRHFSFAGLAFPDVHTTDVVDRH